ncbi:MAG: hypothetical protein GY854_17705 [Deltaproteobacteria bacterium]|nr:hypothetical protein [Deltaproteobacteria bacterium]
MTIIKHTPIFCDNCSSLALAELDTAPLCERCLLAAVRESRDLHLIKRIAPLPFSAESYAVIRGIPRSRSSDEAA